MEELVFTSLPVEAGFSQSALFQQTAIPQSVEKSKIQNYLFMRTIS